MRSGSNIFISVILLSFWCTGCKIKRSISSDSNYGHTAKHKSRLTCTIEAVNLSEDMSVLSSQNDEIIVLFFNPSDSTDVPTRGQIAANIFTKKSDHFSFELDSNLSDTFVSVMIEEDSDAVSERIDSLVRHNIDSLTSYFEKNDYTQIRTILGDDDVLDIRTITYTDSLTFTIQGIHKMDKYKYHVSFFE